MMNVHVGHDQPAWKGSGGRHQWDPSLPSPQPTRRGGSTQDIAQDPLRLAWQAKREKGTPARGSPLGKRSASPQATKPLEGGKSFYLDRGRGGIIRSRKGLRMAGKEAGELQGAQPLLNIRLLTSLGGTCQSETHRGEALPTCRETEEEANDLLSRASHGLCYGSTGPPTCLLQRAGRRPSGTGAIRE